MGNTFEQDDAGRPLLVRGPVDGETLEERINRGDHLEPHAVRRLLESLLEILVHLADRVPPVIHRDIKPSNVVFRNPESWDPVLVDSDTAAAPASDLYGVGTTMLFVVTRIAPEKLHRRAGGRFDVGHRLTGLDAATRRVILRLIEPDRRAGYETAAEALRDLRGQTSATASPSQTKHWKWIVVAVSVTAVSFLMVGIVGYELTEDLREIITPLQKSPEVESHGPPAARGPIPPRAIPPRAIPPRAIPIDAQDLSRVEPTAVLRQVKAIVTGREPRAVMISFGATELSAGLADFTQESRVSGYFGAECLDPAKPPGKDRLWSSISADASKEGLIVSWPGRLCGDLPAPVRSKENAEWTSRRYLPDPACSVAKAWQVAVKSGVPADAISDVGYENRHDFRQRTRRTVWSFRVPGHDDYRREIDGATCAMVTDLGRVR